MYILAVSCLWFVFLMVFMYLLPSWWINVYINLMFLWHGSQCFCCLSSAGILELQTILPQVGSAHQGIGPNRFLTRCVKRLLSQALFMFCIILVFFWMRAVLFSYFAFYRGLSLGCSCLAVSSWAGDWRDLLPKRSVTCWWRWDYSLTHSLTHSLNHSVEKKSRCVKDS